jgi:hypothetical protein
MEVSSSFIDSFSFILMLARGERGDDLLVGDLWNLVPHLAEALDVLSKHLVVVLMHRLKIVLHGGALVRGMKLATNYRYRSFHEVTDSWGRFMSQVREVSLRAMGN